MRWILTSLLDNRTEGRDSRSPCSLSSSSTRSLCELPPPRLASPPLPPSLSPLPSSLSISPPPPAAAQHRRSQRMRERKRGREEGGGLRLAARGGHVTAELRTEGPSTSCPAHASLKTSVAIDNSCRATHQPQLPRHKAIGWQDLRPPPPIVGWVGGACWDV